MPDLERVSRAIDELSGTQLRTVLSFLTDMRFVYRKDLLSHEDRYRGRDQQRRFSRWMKREGFTPELRKALVAMGRSIYYSNHE